VDFGPSVNVCRDPGILPTAHRQSWFARSSGLVSANEPRRAIELESLRGKISALLGTGRRGRGTRSAAAHCQPHRGLEGAACLGCLFERLRVRVDIAVGDIKRGERGFRVLRQAPPPGLD
jgi:hypothetical protein